MNWTQQPAQQAAPPPPRPRFEFRPPPARAAAVMPRPRPVTVSIALWVAAALIGVAAAGLVLLNRDVLHAELLAQVQQQFPTATPGRAERVATAAALVLIGSWLLIEVLLLACGLAMRTRRRRAKVARVALLPLWVFAVLHGAFVLGLTPMPVPVVLLGALVVGLSAAVVMFLPSGNDWFAGQGAHS